MNGTDVDNDGVNLTNIYDMFSSELKSYAKPAAKIAKTDSKTKATAADTSVSQFWLPSVSELNMPAGIDFSQLTEEEYNAMKWSDDDYMYGGSSVSALAAAFDIAEEGAAYQAFENATYATFARLPLQRDGSMLGGGTYGNPVINIVPQRPGHGLLISAAMWTRSTYNSIFREDYPWDKGWAVMLDKNGWTVLDVGMPGARAAIVPCFCL